MKKLTPEEYEKKLEVYSWVWAVITALSGLGAAWMFNPLVGFLVSVVVFFFSVTFVEIKILWILLLLA